MTNKSPPKAHLFNATLHGMEELKNFKTSEDRQRALEEVGSEVRPLDLAIGIALCAAAGFGSFWLVRVLFQYALPSSIPAWVAENSCYVGGALGMFLTMRFLHRWGTARALREKLIVSGVPVCLHCGYKLEGVRERAEVCPECGTAIDPRVAQLLAGAPADQGRTDPAV